MTRATYDITHATRYTYALPARRSVMALCLKPRNDRGQELLAFEVATDPPAPLNAEDDSFGNVKHVFNLHRVHERIGIVSRSRVRPAFPPLVPDSSDPKAWGEIRSWAGSAAHWDYLRPSRLAHWVPALDGFARRLGVEPGTDPLAELRALSDAIHDALDYIPGATTVESTVEHVLEAGEGVCQDYAHLMITIARSWGVPARYVSGYLHLAGVEGEQAPENATHAWAECLLPGLGWTGFDPTNRTLVDSRHVRIAQGRDYHDVSPTRGVLVGGGGARIDVDVRVEVLEEGSGAPPGRVGALARPPVGGDGA